MLCSPHLVLFIVSLSVPIAECGRAETSEPEMSQTKTPFAKNTLLLEGEKQTQRATTQHMTNVRVSKITPDIMLLHQKDADEDRDDRASQNTGQLLNITRRSIVQESKNASETKTGMFGESITTKMDQGKQKGLIAPRSIDLDSKHALGTRIKKTLDDTTHVMATKNEEETSLLLFAHRPIIRDEGGNATETKIQKLDEMEATSKVDHAKQTFLFQQRNINRVQQVCDQLVRLINITNCTCAKLKSMSPDFKCYHVSSSKCHVLLITRARAFFTVVITALGALGNALVLVVRFPPCHSAQQRKNRRTVHYNLIAGLAASDLIFACLFIVTYAPETFMCWWPYGAVFCKISKSLLMTSFAVDITLIFVIAVERYYGIVNSPLRGPWSSTKCNAIVWPLVLVCVVLSAPLFFVYVVSKDGHCVEDWSRVSAQNGSLVYSWISFLCFFLLPVATVTVLHVRSLCWLHRTVFGHLMESLDDVTRVRFVKDNRRILTILITILVSFALLVGPSHVVWLYYDHYGLSRVGLPTRRVLRLFCETTYAFHVAVNPVIYSLVDPSFRKGLKLLFSSSGQQAQSRNNMYQLHVRKHSRSVVSSSIGGS